MKKLVMTVRVKLPEYLGSAVVDAKYVRPNPANFIHYHTYSWDHDGLTQTVRTLRPLEELHTIVLNDVTFVRVNIGPEGASVVVRDNRTGEEIEFPGGPVEVIKD